MIEARDMLESSIITEAKEIIESDQLSYATMLCLHINAKDDPPYAHPHDQDTVILEEQETPQQQSLSQGVELQQSTGGTSHVSVLPPNFTFEELNWVAPLVTQ